MHRPKGKTFLATDTARENYRDSPPEWTERPCIPCGLGKNVMRDTGKDTPETETKKDKKENNRNG